MDLTSQLTTLGGTCDRATLVRLRGRTEVDAALRDGVLVRDARGRYALPTALTSHRVAGAAQGVVSHRSAALAWGWALKAVPTRPDVTVPRNRKVGADARRTLTPHWADLRPGEVQRGRTTRARTLGDCLRSLPFDEALAIADSALRADDVRGDELLALASSLIGRGRARALRVAQHASSQAANPFESVLRAIAIDVPGLELVPQLPVVVSDRLTVHPDLGNPELRLAVEAEGFEWHGDPAALTRDCVRYNALVNLGWTVIRFSWVLVMRQPDYVRRTLQDAFALVAGRAKVHPTTVA